MRRIDLDVAAGKKGAVLKLRARLLAGKSDSDTLKLRCLAAPTS